MGCDFSSTMIIARDIYENRALRSGAVTKEEIREDYIHGPGVAEVP